MAQKSFHEKLRHSGNLPKVKAIADQCQMARLKSAPLPTGRLTAIGVDSQTARARRLPRRACAEPNQLRAYQGVCGKNFGAKEMSASIHIYCGDITKLGADAIVNAANPSLLGGGGVDGAIHLAAGPKLKEYCRKLNGCAVGQAKLSPGFALPALYIIHTVGPIWQGGYDDEPAKLAACYTNSLRLAAAERLKTVAFPAISTGVYGYPKQQAAQIAIKTVRAFLAEDSSIEKVYLVAFDSATAELYQSLLDAPQGRSANRPR